MKTGSEIQGDVYRLLRESGIEDRISGKVYRNGMRPRDSSLEDAVVVFTAGVPGQIETGVVTVDIYIPDITPYVGGAYYEDGERTAEVERIAQDWVDSLVAGDSDYLFSLRDTIRTEEDQDIHQHFVVVKLRYEYYDGNQ